MPIRRLTETEENLIRSGTLTPEEQLELATEQGRIAKSFELRELLEAQAGEDLKRMEKLSPPESTVSETVLGKLGRTLRTLFGYGNNEDEK